MYHCSKFIPTRTFIGRTRATALTLLARRVDVMTLARISGHKDLKTLLRVYYRETAEQISERLASPRR